MDTNKAATDEAQSQSTMPSAPKPLDPLRRIFVPIEKRMTDGRLAFQTSDGEQYVRAQNGVIRRKNPKKEKR